MGTDPRVVWETPTLPPEMLGPSLFDRMALVPVTRLETPLRNSKRFYVHYLDKYHACFPEAAKAAATAQAATPEARRGSGHKKSARERQPLLKVSQLKPHATQEPQLRELAMSKSHLTLQTPTNTLVFNDWGSDRYRRHSRRTLSPEHIDQKDELRVDGFDVRCGQIHKSRAIEPQVERERTTYSTLFKRMAAQRSQRESRDRQFRPEGDNDEGALKSRDSNWDQLEVCLMSDSNARAMRAQRRSERARSVRLAHAHSHAAYGTCCEHAFTCACARERALRERLRPGTVSARSGRPKRLYVDPVPGTITGPIA